MLRGALTGLALGAAAFGSGYLLSWRVNEAASARTGDDDLVDARWRGWVPRGEPKYQRPVGVAFDARSHARGAARASDQRNENPLAALLSLTVSALAPV